MRKLNLCIDIDGTVTEPYYWIPRVNEYFNTNIEPKDVKFYEIHKLLGVKENVYNEFYEIYGELLHKEAKIRVGVKEIINKLYDLHNIYFVTAREERMRYVSLEWLTRNQLPMHGIHLLGSHNKVRKAVDLDCDLFIEDRYENALQLAHAGFEVLLIDCNYNKGMLPSNVTRVRHWFQIDKLIKDYAEQNDEFKVAL
ncbi:nucleotidase [Anaerovorax odorimutans]|uniref:nucleotidase n=1 Tax=Anaerovorax odorimutans TaxID=109327 RepID=UPI0003FC071F|nr:nucleotidase [Anaerovorax odorimutans]